MTQTGIYALHFTTGGLYVGQAQDIAARYKQHVKDLQTGEHTQKMQSAYTIAGSLPAIEILLECHRDYLDIFECWFINRMKPSLNTSRPKNVLEGVCQQGLDALVANKDNSIMYTLAAMASKLGKLDRLKLALEEADEEIERLEHVRNMQEIEAAGKSRIYDLRDQVKEKDTLIECLTEEAKRLEKELDAAKSELTRLRERNILERILNS